MTVTLVHSVEPGFPPPTYRTTDRRFRVVRRALMDGWAVFDTSGGQPFAHPTLPDCSSCSTYAATLNEARAAIQEVTA